MSKRLYNKSIYGTFIYHFDYLEFINIDRFRKVNVSIISPDSYTYVVFNISSIFIPNMFNAVFFREIKLLLSSNWRGRYIGGVPVW